MGKKEIMTPLTPSVPLEIQNRILGFVRDIKEAEARAYWIGLIKAFRKTCIINRERRKRVITQLEDLHYHHARYIRDIGNLEFPFTKFFFQEVCRDLYRGFVLTEYEYSCYHRYNEKPYELTWALFYIKVR